MRAAKAVQHSLRGRGEVFSLVSYVQSDLLAEWLRDRHNFSTYGSWRIAIVVKLYNN